MQGPKEKVTMRTIADEAGVTLTTVSRILNNKGDKYADKTKARIIDIAERLKYRPNALVHGMQTGKTGTAGIIIPASKPFYSQVLEGIQNEFINNGTIMLLSWNNHSANDNKESIERDIILQMIDRRVEGIILNPASEEFERSYLEEIRERDIPLILVDRELSKHNTDFVGTDDMNGGAAAAQYLISLGHHNLLFLGPGKSVSTCRYREEGFRKLLSESPNAFCKSIIIEQESNWQDLIHLLKSDDAPTAIFCYNDSVARQAGEVIMKAGLSIPGDVSLIGFGNTPCTDCTLLLTTFEQHPQKIGSVAARIYQERVKNPEKDGIRRELIPAELIVRNTTRALHTAAPR